MPACSIPILNQKKMAQGTLFSLITSALTSSISDANKNGTKSALTKQGDIFIIRTLRGSVR